MFGFPLPKVFKFAVVGGMGFVIDTFSFSVFVYLFGLDVMLARLMAFFIAATSTWFGNRVFTFSSSANMKAESRFHQWRKFMLVACISAIPNMLVFKGVMTWLGEQGAMIYVALACGILVGMVSNYVMSEKWVFAQTDL